MSMPRFWIYLCDCPVKSLATAMDICDANDAKERKYMLRHIAGKLCKSQRLFIYLSNHSNLLEIRMLEANKA